MFYTRCYVALIIMKYFEKRKLIKFLSNLENNNFPDGYLDHHRDKIDCLKWLVASYEGRAGNAKELLESMLNPIKTTNCDRDAEWVKIIYYWINYKRIVGF